MTVVESQVLIVGAGPVGLITGLLLDRLGIDFLILERRQTLHQAPQAHVISSRSLEICRSVGIDHREILARGPKLKDTLCVRWVDRLLGRDLGVFVMGSDPAEVMRMLTQTPSPTTNLSQDQFEQVLFDHLAARGGSEKVLFGHEWESYAEEDEHCLSTVNTDDGILKVASDYLIGADGAGSRVRKAAGIDMLGPDNIQTYVNIHFSDNLRNSLRGREALLYWVMDEEVTGTFIAHDIEDNWIFMKTVDGDESLDPIDEEKYAALLVKAIGADLQVEIHSMNTWRMSAQIASSYRRGRLYLVGDAAHRFPPTGGIGMNTGFQDAHNLVWKIGMVNLGMDARVLDTYESERKPVAERNSEQSLQNAMKMMQVAKLLDVDGDQRITKSDLDAVLADSGRIMAVQRAINAQAPHFNMSGLDLGVCYEGMGIISDGLPPQSDNPVSIYLPSTTPGARLPHAMLEREGTEVSTLDLVPYEHFLVLTQGAPQLDLSASVAKLSRRGVPLREARIGDSEMTPIGDQFERLFNAQEVLLIRPDGHIAARFSMKSAARDLLGAMDQLWSFRPDADN